MELLDKETSSIYILNVVISLPLSAAQCPPHTALLDHIILTTTQRHILQNREDLGFPDANMGLGMSQKKLESRRPPMAVRTHQQNSRQDT